MEKKLNKLINRLNKHYISYDSKELKNYKKMIFYDETKKMFAYQGRKFNETDIREYQKYDQKKKAWNQLKRRISEQIQKIDFNGEDENTQIIIQLTKELPFQDEYFIFNLEKVLTTFNIQQYFEDCMLEAKDVKMSAFTKNNVYQELYNIFVTNGVLWLTLFTRYGFSYSLISELVDEAENVNIRKIINEIGKIVKIAKDLKLDLKNYREFSLLNEIATCSSSIKLAILGKETIRRLCEDKSYTFANESLIVNDATKLVSRMVTRSKSTVPYIEGQTQNYQYSLYDSQDESILLSGINTYSCFKIGGDDNDFLHYCALDKNGFVIKIINHQEVFIAKASGFRHGNCVFINQFRTIYDDANEKDLVNGEIKDIIEVFEIACQDFIQTSLKNENETDKIEYVFATKNEFLACCPEKQILSQEISWKLNCPMDTVSDDWKKFTQNTPSLTEECIEDNYFTTDYRECRILCMASIKTGEEINYEDIKLKDVEAVYERKRNQVIITKHPTEDMIRKINKTKAIQIYQSGMKSFESVKISERDITCFGDNWYLIYRPDGHYDCCVLMEDKKAKIEFLATKYMLEENALKGYQHHQTIEIEDMANALEEELLKKDSKVLKRSF